MFAHLILLGIGAAIVVTTIFILASIRVVVPTNAVHIVQSSKRTTSYGKDQPGRNTYYAWPYWIPLIGVKVIQLPVSVFPIKLQNYAAYDKGRVPFIIDIIAFFRIEDSNTAAQRVSTFEDLNMQLIGILQGVCRTILAKSEIEEILEGRSIFGEMFTKEVDENLRQWGAQSVKQIELMDIRDEQGSQVIQNIMAKKKSLIEKESRVTVAQNMQAAQVAEIEAQQTVLVRQQVAQEQVGIRTAQKDQEIGIATQKSQQAVKEEEKNTATAAMAVIQVQEVRKAEIVRDVQVVIADQTRQVAIVDATGKKQQTILLAEGNLEQARLSAQGIQMEGDARGKAETAALMAPVTAQIALADKISSDEGYQKYLIEIRNIDQVQAVGMAMAKALEAAQIKVISNTGAPVDGVKSVMELLTSKGGTNIAAAVEAFAQTPTGEAIVKRITGNGTTATN